MADNFTVEPVVGTPTKTFASDDIAGVDWPYSKLAFGGRDAANEVDDVSGKRLPVKAYIAPETSGGLSKFHLVFAASTNANSIKASAGQVYSVRVFNNADYPIFVKFHNTAAAPTPGTGVVETIGVQAGTQLVHVLSQGDAFGTGIGLTVTKGISDADVTSVAANDGVVDVFYA